MRSQSLSSDSHHAVLRCLIHRGDRRQSVDILGLPLLEISADAGVYAHLTAELYGVDRIPRLHEEDTLDTGLDGLERTLGLAFVDVADTIELFLDRSLNVLVFLV